MSVKEGTHSKLPLQTFGRVVQTRLQAFLDTNGLMPEMQSAYRRHHSIETAVMKVYNDLLSAADNGQLSALCLLDLTAAFDTVAVSYTHLTLPTKRIV